MSTDSPTLKRYVVHPSGGLIWHWRALQNRHRWNPLNRALADWLAQWALTSNRLVLVGPSAGWTLPADLLSRFAEVRALEPDPIARQLLRRRFRSVRFEFDDTDIFADGSFQALSVYTDHAVLFCNVLGQLCPADEAEAKDWCTRLRAALTNLHWASYHELISCERAPDDHLHRDFASNTSLDEVLARFWSGGSLDIRDHNTMTVARGLPFSCVPWLLSKRQWHLVQWCHSA